MYLVYIIALLVTLKRREWGRVTRRDVNEITNKSNIIHSNVKQSKA